jgi:hypothetical protein
MLAATGHGVPEECSPTLGTGTGDGGRVFDSEHSTGSGINTWAPDYIPNGDGWGDSYEGHEGNGQGNPERYKVGDPLQRVLFRLALAELITLSIRT